MATKNKQGNKKENPITKILGTGINKAADFGIKCLKKMSDTANNINKSTANLYDGLFNPNKKNKTNSNKTNKANHKIPTNSQKNKGGFVNMVNNVVGGAQKFLNDKIAPWLATEGSIKAKVTETINAQGMDKAIEGVRNDCLRNPNSKQCKVGTRTINNRIEQENLQNQGWGR